MLAFNTIMEEFYNRPQHHEQHYTTRELGVPLEISEPIWQIHYITFGVIFSTISLYILLSILGLLRDDREKKFQRRHYFLWMNLALFYFSLVMSVALLADPFEERRYITSRKLRMGLRLLVRLRLPCLAVAFSLVQVSLLNITEVVLYATWFHNLITIFILNSIQLALVVISSVTSMFVANTTLVWFICDIYMFFLFAGNSIISLYTGAKIILCYHRYDSKFCKMVTSSGSWYRSTYGNVNDDAFTTKEIDIKPHEGEDNAAFIIGGEVESNFQCSKLVLTSSDTSNDDTTFKKDNVPVPMVHKERSVSIRRPSSYPIYVDEHKAVVQKRRIGSLPYQTRTSKFSDKSIRKVAILMMIVAMFGLVMCVTIVLSLYSAKIFHAEQIGPWKWYALRTVRRAAEVGITGTMAYMVRRTMHCW